MLLQEDFNNLVTKVYPGISTKIFDEEVFQVLDEDGSGSIVINQMFFV